jgi:hypothetical protein
MNECSVCLVVGTIREETTRIGEYNYCEEHLDHASTTDCVHKCKTYNTFCTCTWCSDCGEILTTGCKYHPQFNR